MGSIIATIISSQPRAKSAGLERPAAPTVRRVVEVVPVRRAFPQPQGEPGGDGERDERRRRGSRGRAAATRRWAGANIAAAPRRRRQAAKRKWPCRALWPWRSTLGIPCGAPVPRELARLARVDGRARDRAEDRLGERGRVAGRADERRHLGLDDLPDREPALAAVDGEGDRGALDRDDLADQPGEIGDRAAELPGEQPEQRALLLGGGALVDEHDGLPGLRDEDVLGDVGGDGHASGRRRRRPRSCPSRCPRRSSVSQVL